MCDVRDELRDTAGPTCSLGSLAVGASASSSSPVGPMWQVDLPGLGRLPMAGGPWSRPHPVKPLPVSWCTETGEMAHAACIQLLFKLFVTQQHTANPTG